MSKISNLKISWFFVFFQQGSIFIFGFGSFMLLIRILDKDDFGIWTLFIVISGVLSTLRIGMVRNAQIRFSNIYKELQAEYRTAAFYLNLFLSIVVIATLISLSFFINDILSINYLDQIFRIYSIIYLILVPHTFIEFYIEEKSKFKFNLYANLIRQGIFFLILLGVFIGKFNVTLIELMGFQLISVVFSLFFLITIRFRKCFLLTSLQWEKLKELFNYGKFVLGSSINSVLAKSIDHVMIAYFLGPSYVAIYNPAAKLTNLFEIPINTMATIIFPISSKNERKSYTYLKYLYEKSVGYNLVITVPILLIIIIFSEQIILTIAGSGFSETVPILRLYILVVLFKVFGRQAGMILDSIGMQKYTFYLSLFSAFFNIMLNYLLITSFGIIGAVSATLITAFLLFILSQFLMNKIVSVNVLSVFKFSFHLLISQKNYLINRFNKKNPRIF